MLIKKSIITSQIKHDIKEFNGIKFSVGLSIQFFHDEGNGKQKQVIGQNHGEQSAIFDDNKVDEFYDSQVAYLQTWIEKFTNTASGLEIAHCIKLYLNIAKFEPLKGSSYIPLPEALANKKAIINLKNDDNKCLEWALLSALYHDSNNPSKISSYKKHLGVLNMDGIDFPTPISQISRVEKKNNLAINIYGATVSPKLEKINVCPYHISEQPTERQRINLLLLSEDAEDAAETRQSTTIAGLKISTDCSMIKTNINVKHTFVTGAYMASQKKTCSSNTKRIVKASIKTQQE